MGKAWLKFSFLGWRKSFQGPPVALCTWNSFGHWSLTGLPSPRYRTHIHDDWNNWHRQLINEYASWHWVTARSHWTRVWPPIGISGYPRPATRVRQFLLDNRIPSRDFDWPMGKKTGHSAPLPVRKSTHQTLNFYGWSQLGIKAFLFFPSEPQYYSKHNVNRQSKFTRHR